MLETASWALSLSTHWPLPKSSKSVKGMIFFFFNLCCTHGETQAPNSEGTPKATLPKLEFLLASVLRPHFCSTAICQQGIPRRRCSLVKSTQVLGTYLCKIKIQTLTLLYGLEQLS
jgi:hypothetical protein